MKKNILFSSCLAYALLFTSCGTTYVVPNRAYGYRPDFTRTYSDKSVYRPAHYRNFVNANTASQRQNTAALSSDGRSDEVYLVRSYLDTHTETSKPVYHTTYTTSYNDNGEVTTTYTTDYVGTKKEEQYWDEVRKEQKRAYQQSRKKKKMKVKDMDD